MMTVKEIVAIELANTNSIYLFREGMFYRAYNCSAMRMVLLLKAFKVNHKLVKTVQQEIFYIGFPCNSLPSIKNRAIDKGWQIAEPIENDTCKMIVVQGVLSKEEDYQTWVEKQLQLSLAPFPKFQTLEKVGELEKLITDFPIENATPMEALMFVNKLKQLIRHGNVR